ATGCASAPSSSASTVSAATFRASPSPSAPTSRRSEQQLRLRCRPMSTRNTNTVTISLPSQRVAELDRVSHLQVFQPYSSPKAIPLHADFYASRQAQPAGYRRDLRNYSSFTTA